MHVPHTQIMTPLRNDYPTAKDVRSERPQWGTRLKHVHKEWIRCRSDQPWGEGKKRTLRVLSWKAVDVDVETRWFSTGTVLGYVVR